MEGRVWCLVEIEGVEEIVRPAAQGGIWYLAQRLKLLKELPYAHRYTKSKRLRPNNPPWVLRLDALTYSIRCIWHTYRNAAACATC